MRVSVVMPACAWPDPKDLAGPPHPQLASALGSVIEAAHVGDNAPADLVAARDALSIEVLVGVDGEAWAVEEAVRAWAIERSDPPKLLVRCVRVPAREARTWGNPARNALIPEAVGSYLYFQDQDDRFLPGSLVGCARDAARWPGRPIFYRMRVYQQGGHTRSADDPDVLWKARGEIAEGKVGGHCLFVPNVAECLGRWEPEEEYAADFRFIEETVRRFRARGIEPEWSEEFVSACRPWAVGL